MPDHSSLSEEPLGDAPAPSDNPPAHHPGKATTLIVIWFLVLLFGPYFTLFGLRIRADHLLMPLIAATCIFQGWRRERKIYVPLWILPILLLMATAVLSTALSCTRGEYEFSMRVFLAGLESHARIVMIILAAAQLKRGSIRMPTVLAALGVAAFLLACLAILQVYPDEIWASTLARKMSIALYEGPHSSRGSSVVVQCLTRTDKRAVASLYHPGNCALFFCTVMPFLVFTEHFRRVVRRMYVPALVTIVLGWSLTISEGFIAGLPLLMVYAAWRRRWRPLAYLVFALAVTVPLVVIISSYAKRSFTEHIFQNSPTDYYNVYFGSKFGRLGSENSPAAQPTKETPVRTPPSGYLDDAFATIRRRPVIGVGYVPDSKAGDSMIVHLMVVSGTVGTAAFAVFITGFAMSIIRRMRSVDSHTRHAYHAYLLVLFMYVVFGIAFPTFVQDRAGDVFWWMGALLGLTTV